MWLRLCGNRGTEPGERGVVVMKAGVQGSLVLLALVELGDPTFQFGDFLTEPKASRAVWRRGEWWH